jgi:hypothetical protein
MDTIIPYSSIDPSQQKYATIRYLYNRLHTYQLDNEEYNQEENIIHNILYNNSFPIQIRKLPNPKQNQTQNTQKVIPKKKWAMFTYIGKETTYITKISNIQT